MTGFENETGRKRAPWYLVTRPSYQIPLSLPVTLKLIAAAVAR